MLFKNFVSKLYFSLIEHPGRLIYSGFLVSVLVLAFYQTPWLDEEYSLNTTSTSLSDAYLGAVHFEGQPPLYFAALQIWRTVSHSEYWARMFSTLWIILTLPLLPKISRQYLPGLHPVWLLLLFSLNPYIFWASLEIRCYGMAIFLTAALVYLFYKAFIEGVVKQRDYLLFTLVAVCALFTHFYAGFLLFSLGCTLLLFKGWKQFCRYLLCMILPVLFLGLFYRNIQTSFDAHTTTSTSFATIKGAFNLIATRLEMYLTSFDAYSLNGYHRLLFRLFVSGTILLLGFKYAKQLKVKILFYKNYPLIILLISCVLIMVAYFAVSEKYVLKRHTYFLYLPAILTILFSIEKTFRKYSWTVISFLLLVNFVGIVKADYLPRHNNKVLAHYVENNETNGEKVFIYPCELGFSFNYKYRGQNEIIVMPKPISIYDEYNNASWVIKDSAQLDTLFRKHIKSGDICWFICVTDDLKYYGMNYNIKTVESYIHHNFTVMKTYRFDLFEVIKLKFQ